MADDEPPVSRRGSARARRVRFGDDDQDDQVVVYVHEIPSRFSPLDDISNWSYQIQSEEDSAADRSTFSEEVNPALTAVIVANTPLASFVPIAAPYRSGTPDSVPETAPASARDSPEESTPRVRSPKTRRKTERRRRASITAATESASPKIVPEAAPEPVSDRSRTSTVPVSSASPRVPSTSPLTQDSCFNSSSSSTAVTSVSFTSTPLSMASNRALPSLRSTRPSSAKSHVVSGLAPQSRLSDSSPRQFLAEGRASPLAGEFMSLLKQPQRLNGLAELGFDRAQSAPSAWSWSPDPFEKPPNSNADRQRNGFSQSDSKTANSWQRSFSWQTANRFTGSGANAPTVQVQQMFDDFYK